MYHKFSVLIFKVCYLPRLLVCNVFAGLVQSAFLCLYFIITFLFSTTHAFFYFFFLGHSVFFFYAVLTLLQIIGDKIIVGSSN